ncbi:hypothetical protein ACS0TY_018091 [Phlomoides rotata]
MGGKVYLKTNRFEVRLEGIKFKAKDFEHLCKMDFLFPDGKNWDQPPPVVGLDVMRHPCDPSILLVLLCFGVGCVILRFVEGKPVPAPILKFLSDKRIRFVGFGIPEKRTLFPFEELGISKSKADVGYLAAKILKQPKCKKLELAELARKILGIKKMVGLTDTSSSQRHEKIKCAICQLFVTSVIAMALLRVDDTKKSDKKSSFVKNLNSFHSFTNGWFKGKKRDEGVEENESINVHIGEADDLLSDEDFLGTESPYSKIEDGDDKLDIVQAQGEEEEDDSDSDNDCEMDASCTSKVQLKGILKCPSTRVSNHVLSPTTPRSALKRANSKGCNVRFECE